MKTYILFIYGTFENHEEIEFFCLEVLKTSELVGSLRYVIESSQNLIVLFDSDLDTKQLSTGLYNLLMTNDTIKFYFMFNKENLITAHLPIQLRDFIFKPIPTDETVVIDIVNGEPTEYNLDDVLEKIKTKGIESLTQSEKNFLDNFDN
jgi:signal recognition particle receptor subunit beta